MKRNKFNGDDLNLLENNFVSVKNLKSMTNSDQQQLEKIMNKLKRQ
jgi:DNA-binding IscR family transcriptional regulator